MGFENYELGLAGLKNQRWVLARFPGFLISYNENSIRRVFKS